eukprot:m.43870 g.43870  ORF g.43870 m.43870 type:complete len:53 (+) comp46865_c0_seq3:127-285(+)
MDLSFVAAPSFPVIIFSFSSALLLISAHFWTCFYPLHFRSIVADFFLLVVCT